MGISKTLEKPFKDSSTRALVPLQRGVMRFCSQTRVSNVRADNGNVVESETDSSFGGMARGEDTGGCLRGTTGSFSESGGSKSPDNSLSVDLGKARGAGKEEKAFWVQLCSVTQNSSNVATKR